jgi:BirA family biotin operon repressor/biotin-[acetyl-CoA-carboxylase] ligase
LNIIKLNATDSTNDYLKSLIKDTGVANNTVVVTVNQKQGKGQHGNIWKSQKGKSLTFSIYRAFTQHKDCYPFMPQMVVSLAIVRVLQSFNIPGLRIKWPNDILSYNKKIAGILIENIWTKGQPTHRIIGIGLNVNDLADPALPKATSLFGITGQQFDLDEVLIKLHTAIVQDFDAFKVVNQQVQFEHYHSYLYKKDAVATFKDGQGVIISAIVKGVSPEGSLQLEHQDEKVKSYAVKEVSMQY